MKTFKIESFSPRLYFCLSRRIALISMTCKSNASRQICSQHLYTQIKLVQRMKIHNETNKMKDSKVLIYVS